MRFLKIFLIVAVASLLIVPASFAQGDPEESEPEGQYLEPSKPEEATEGVPEERGEPPGGEEPIPGVPVRPKVKVKKPLFQRAVQQVVDFFSPAQQAEVSQFPPDITRVSVGPNDVEANENSTEPSLSGDGRYIVFRSSANNLVPHDDDDINHLFIHDIRTDETTSVTVGALYENDPNRPILLRNHGMISANGRYLAYIAQFFDLTPARNRGFIVIHDRENERVWIPYPDFASVHYSGGFWRPSISADGSRVVYRIAERSDPDDHTLPYDYTQNILLYDLEQTEESPYKITMGLNGQMSNGDSQSPSISPDGRYVAFQSSASNLVEGDMNGFEDIFVYDHQSRSTTRISMAHDGTESNGNSSYPSINADGRYVAFTSSASNLVDLVDNDTNELTDIFVYDRQEGKTTRVSVTSDGTEGNGESLHPSINADGRYVAFTSSASNLVDNDTNAVMDVFVYSRLTKKIALVSVAADGTTQGDDESGVYCNYTMISDNGQYIVFSSAASNLVPGDTNNQWDVFRTRNPLYRLLLHPVEPVQGPIQKPVRPLSPGQ